MIMMVTLDVDNDNDDLLSHVAIIVNDVDAVFIVYMFVVLIHQLIFN